MVIVIILVAILLALIVICVAINRHYTSWKNYRRKIVSTEKVKRMKMEHWYQHISPVFIVEYEDDLPPGNRPTWPYKPS